MRIISVVGARSIFIKVALLIHGIQKFNSGSRKSWQKKTASSIKHFLLHTCQLYDDWMSKAFFDQHDIPEPDNNRGIVLGTLV